MGKFRFQILELRESTPRDWLLRWAKRYDDDGDYDPVAYQELIEKHNSLLSDDFRRIGKWKDSVTTEARWKPNVASVAFQIWEELAREMPKCPRNIEVDAFLSKWSERSYIDDFSKRSVKKRFGLSRATTLLHFLSGGRFPIFDSRVRTAVARLVGSPELPNSLEGYKKFRENFKELASSCGCETEKDCRMLDKALFSYGALENRAFSS